MSKFEINNYDLLKEGQRYLTFQLIFLDEAIELLEKANYSQYSTFQEKRWAIARDLKKILKDLLLNKFSKAESINFLTKYMNNKEKEMEDDNKSKRSES